MEEIQETEKIEVGAVLRNRRLELGLTFESIAEQTKIRKAYLQALEDERFEDLPGEVYIVGFLQNYARALGLSAEALINSLESRQDVVSSKTHPRRQQPSAARAGMPSAKPRSSIRVIGWLILLLLLIVAAFYYFMSLRNDHGAGIFSPAAAVSSDSVRQDRRQDLNVEISRPTDADQRATLAGPIMEASEAAAEPLAESLPGETLPLLLLPAGGGTLKLVADGRGDFSIAVDGGTIRQYKAKPGLVLNWFVEQEAALDLQIDGVVQLWIDQEMVELSGVQILKLTSAKGQEGDQ